MVLDSQVLFADSLTFVEDNFMSYIGVLILVYIVFHGFLFLCQYCAVLVTVVQYINIVLGSIFLKQGLNSVSMSVLGLC